LKNANPSGDYFIESNLNNVNNFFLKIVKIELKAGLSRRWTDRHVCPSVTSDKALVHQIRVNAMLTSDRVKPELLCPRWLLHGCHVGLFDASFHYIIGAGECTAWWGCAWLPEGHARLPSGQLVKCNI
jgi:hypothetical protein